VRIDIPLLPVSVEVHRRPLRPFRVSIRGLMIAIVLAGVFFALVAELRRLTLAANYHAEEMIKANAIASRFNTLPLGTTPLEAWHMRKIAEYRLAHERLDLIAFAMLMAFVSLFAVAALGRVVHWLSRPSAIPPQDGSPRRTAELLRHPVVPRR
jgi:hypothetical protein